MIGYAISVFDDIIHPSISDARALRWRSVIDVMNVSSIGARNVITPKNPILHLLFLTPSRSISSPARNIM